MLRTSRQIRKLSSQVAGTTLKHYKPPATELSKSTQRPIYLYTESSEFPAIHPLSQRPLLVCCLQFFSEVRGGPWPAGYLAACEVLCLVLEACREMTEAADAARGNKVIGWRFVCLRWIESEHFWYVSLLLLVC